LDRLIVAALAEDLFPDPAAALQRVPWEPRRALAPGALAAWLKRDLTAAVIPPKARGQGRLLAKQAGVLYGLALFRRVFELLDDSFVFQPLLDDGSSVAAQTDVARLSGRARALLVGERTALNFLQRLSGTASLTQRFVALAAGRVAVLDTRKTNPGWRALQKAAVLAGGGQNHRLGLFDEVMLKDNHADFSAQAGESPPARLARLVAAVRHAHGPKLRLHAEARDLPQALAALEAGADVLLLDNFTPEGLIPVTAALKARAATLGRSVLLEASGGIRLDTLERFAQSGVDRVSVGALTHSAGALDLSLELEPVEASAPLAGAASGAPRGPGKAGAARRGQRALSPGQPRPKASARTPNSAAQTAARATQRRAPQGALAAEAKPAKRLAVSGKSKGQSRAAKKGKRK
jgi:nicotinate-nucleotide pyrophosphorylase (carboxylating)